jgi:hypothetical protein
MAALPNGSVAADEPRSSLDKLTDEVLLSGDLDEPEGGDVKTEDAPKSVAQADFDALKKSNDDLKAQAEITNRYLQGHASQNQETRQQVSLSGL